MGWSWRLGRIAGIDVFMHFTFLLLVAWIGFSHYMAHGDVREALVGVAFILALFGIIVLHELGHALAARRYGIETRDITLLPIGGVARLERMPDKTWQELVVAVAGPLVNVVIALAIYVGLRYGPGDLTGIERSARVGSSFLSQMFWINVMLVVFNLVPAFPMDGGRVLRALLAMRLDYVRATQIAASIGQAVAILFAALGLMGNPMLLFIALFVWLGASQEASMVQMRAAMAGIPVRQVMVTNFHTLDAHDPLGKAADFVLAGFQQDFPVLEAGRLAGVLTRNDLVAGLAGAGPDMRVGDAMQREFVATGPREMLENAFQSLHECQCHTLPVMEGDRLLGLLTAENVAEALMIQAALRGNGLSRHGARSL